MNNPIKSQIAANRERFDEKFPHGVKHLWLDNGNDEGHVKDISDSVKDFLTTSQTSLIQTAIAAVEGMKDFSLNDAIASSEGSIIPTEAEIEREMAWNSALSKVVELLKGGIEII